MRFKNALTKLLFRILPEGDRQRMASDLITWMNSDLPHMQQREMIDISRPVLLKMIGEGRIGLSLLIYHYLSRFFTTHHRFSEEFPEVPPHLKSV